MKLLNGMNLEVFLFLLVVAQSFWMYQQTSVSLSGREICFSISFIDTAIFIFGISVA